LPVFFWGLTIPTSAFIIQIIWWRIHLPRYQTKTVIGIFIGLLVLVLGFLFFGRPDIGPLAPMSLWQYLHISILNISLLCAWVITYSAFEADSPTLVMVARLLKAGPKGVSEKDLLDSMSDEVLLVPRVNDLIRDHLATLDDKGRYHLTGKGHLFLTLVYGYRKLLGAPTGG